MAYNNVKVKARQTVVQSNTQTKDLGTVSEVPMGKWNTIIQYKKLNTVRAHNATYIAKKDNQGVEPTVTQGWQEVWQVVAYDGGAVSPDGDYPQMSVGQATNDGNGNNIAQSIQNIREDMQNESHFRGYLATNAEIKALSGTPNDYAYSAESGTVWIYQTETGWTNSGKPVPDQTTPASNTLPLADGIASAGTSNAYARGDHIHPKFDILNYLFPIGSHYIQFNTEATPAAKFGGTWQVDTDYAGRVLVGSGEGYSLGATGGTAEHTHGTSDLYAKIMMHSWGSIPASFKNVPKWQGSYVVESGGTGKSEVTDNWEGVNLGGELAKANNLQPYKVVNVWKRIA